LLKTNIIDMPKNFHTINLSLEELDIIKMSLKHSVKTADWDLYNDSKAELILKQIDKL